jgi:beta-hydroxyacyl-ACP dehydratase FabZ
MIKDIAAILATLPHRYPFLMLDRILELTADSAVGLKNVTYNEPYFMGHFPEEPIMPGVMIIEAMAQLGGILGYSIRQQEKGKAVYFMAMDKVRFRKPVRPGDQLILKARVIKQKGPVFKMQTEAYVADHLVAEAELMATMGAPARAPQDAESPSP